MSKSNLFTRVRPRTLKLSILAQRKIVCVGFIISLCRKKLLETYKALVNLKFTRCNHVVK